MKFYSAAQLGIDYSQAVDRTNGQYSNQQILFSALFWFLFVRFTMQTVNFGVE